MKRKATRILAGALALAALLAALYLLSRLSPAIRSLARPQAMKAFQERLQSYGFWGALILAGAQLIQVVSGVIPALPIQLAAGLTYGALPGLLLCLSGIFFGSALVFLLVKKFGRPAVNRIFPLEKQKKLSFLQDARRLETIVFILYFIPAMPKDVFTYLAALTSLPLGRYLLITMAARAPTIFCNTFASGALMEGKYGQAILVFCVTSALGLLCMFASPRILSFLEERFKK